MLRWCTSLRLEKFQGIFNPDGKLEGFERTADFNMFTSLMEDEEEKTELEMSGLDPDKLEFMDVDERYAALEDARLDSDDYDF